jgi:S-adenosylmethionine hydrolase
MRLEPPFGNLETSFVASGLRSLQIASGSSFGVRCRENTFTVLLGQHWTDVPRGGWVAYVSMEDGVIIARNAANASEQSGCRPGDSVFVTANPRP